MPYRRLVRWTFAADSRIRRCPLNEAALRNVAQPRGRAPPRLASNLPSLDGIVLISGVSPGASANGVPALLVYEERDRRFAPTHMHDFASTSADVTQLPMPFGHFLLAKEFEAVRDAVSAWLAERT